MGEFHIFRRLVVIAIVVLPLFRRKFSETMCRWVRASTTARAAHQRIPHPNDACNLHAQAGAIAVCLSQRKQVDGCAHS
jgi:hypothetical protein